MFYPEWFVEEWVEYASREPHTFLFYALITLSPFFVASSYFNFKLHQCIENKVKSYHKALKESQIKVEKWKEFINPRDPLDL